MNAQQKKLKAKTLRVLKVFQKRDDTEGAHVEADEALCILLEGLGHGDVVKEWKKVDKWYS